MPTAQEAQEMMTVEDREQIRIAYFIEDKSERQIAKELQHSRRTIKRALAGAEAFQFYGGVPRHVTYDNLTTAVQQILVGQQRAEQRQFIALRSHYVFESRFCTPGEGHEKGGVESAVGYVRRNFLSPPPHVDN